jgi:hypothetical protein
VEDGNISAITVKRGAPCGATWEAAQRVIGLDAAEAPIRIGLEVQFFCSADPAGWDPIHGKSPVHFAGKIHRKALEQALSKKSRDNGT